MASFNELADLQNFKQYKVTLKTALARIKPGMRVNFVYLEKFAFEDKERTLILVDHDAELVKNLGRKPGAVGKCAVNDADKFVFTSSADIKIAKVVKMFAEAGIPRAVHDPEDAPDEPSRVPEGTQLKMKHGWTEIRTWGKEAQDLIDAFDGLVGVYKGLPTVQPDWADLVERLGDVKARMAEMLRTRITNDAQAREAELVKVNQLTKVARKLASDIRDRAIVTRDSEAPVRLHVASGAAEPTAGDGATTRAAVHEPLKPSAQQEQATREADKLSDAYEQFQARFGPVFKKARELGLPTDALVEAESVLEKALRQPATLIVQQIDRLKPLLLSYAKIGKALAEANAAHQAMLQEQALQAQAARERQAREDQQRQDELARQARIGQDRADRLARKRIEQERQAEAVRQADALREAQAEADRQAEVLRQEAPVEQQADVAADAVPEPAVQPSPLTPKQRADRRKKSDPDPVPVTPPATRKKVRYERMAPTPVLTFKEKFDRNMLQRVGDVVKMVTGFDNAGGFSTHYKFSQGDSDVVAYELHVHRSANGRFRSGQVKFGRLAAVVRGGEEDLKASELVTYGIPDVETFP